MRFGITMFATDRTMRADELAREAEARGFDSLFVPEHTHIPASRATPAPMGEPLPEQYYRAFDPYVALTWAAATTERIRIGTGIALVAQHDPIVLAKTIATLDVLSQGRFVLGIGYGWNREEMADHGVAYERRRAVVREKVLAMKALWRDEIASFEGEYVRFEPSYAWPKPVQQPHPPIWIGAAPGPTTLRHVAEFADAWSPIGGRGIAEALPALKDACETAGRDPATVRVVPFGTIPAEGKLDHFRSLGIDEVVCGLEPGTRDVILPVLDRYAGIAVGFR